MDDLYELYVLGALEPELAAEVERYIAEHPLEAKPRLEEASNLAAAMAGMAERVKPPAELRQRVLATIAPRRHSRNWMFAFGALAAACIALAIFAYSSSDQLQRAHNQLRSVGTANTEQQAQVIALTSERDRLRTDLANANRAQQTEVAALTGERDRLRATLASANGAQRTAAAALTRERDQFRSTLDLANRTNQAQVAALTGERDQLRSALETANTRNQAQVAALTREVSQLRSALATANSAAQVQMAGLTGEVNQLQSAFAIMRRPDTRSVRFGTPEAPHGWVFSNRRGGLVFVGSQLPSLANDRTLELWLVPKSGAPRPAGLFRPNDTAGDTVHTSLLAVNPSEIKAVAVSEEPAAGSTAPTTKPFLLVPLGE
jgi:anti-sigma-K factor RskA